MIGVGNLTELTEADTTGIDAMLTGIISELRIGNLLATEVNPHCRSVVCELDLARRMMHRARAEGSLPKQISGGLSALHEPKPFPCGPDEIRAAARKVKDRNFLIQVSGDAIRIYNREGHHCASDPFDLYPHLEVEQDGAHVSYLGVELARAQIALRLGRRYSQENMLDRGAHLRLPRKIAPASRPRLQPRGSGRVPAIRQLHRERADAESALDELRNPCGCGPFTTAASSAAAS